MNSRYTDPWITTSMRHAALLADGDAQLYDAYTAAQEAFLTEVRAAVLPDTDTVTAAADPGHRIRQWPDTSRWVELLTEHVLPVLKSWYTRVFRRNKHADGEPTTSTWFEVEQEYRDAFHRDTWADQLHTQATDEIADSASHDDPPTLVRDRLSRLLHMDAPIRSLRDRITNRLRQGESPDEVDVSDGEHTHRNQARLRARHSTVGAANRATLDVAEQSPETLFKSWVATPDEAVRRAHWHSNKQSVPLHDRFTVGDAQLRYPGDPTGPPHAVANCRCTLLLLDQQEHEQSNRERAMELPNRTDTNGNPLIAAIVASDTDNQPSGYWRAELAPLETRGDYRVIGHPPNGEVRMSSQAWLLHQPHTDEKHNKSYIVGKVDTAWIDNSVLMAEGTLDMDDPNAREVHRKLAEGYLGTVSVDLEDATAEERYYNTDGEHVTDFASHNPDELRKLLYFTDWRLGGATLVPHPAFHEARVMVNVDNDTVEASAEPATTAASAGDSESDCAECDDDAPSDPNTGGEFADDVPQHKRDRASNSGAALPDGSYPIENREDLKNAIQAYGRARNKTRVKKHIIKRAKTLGLTSLLPNNWGNVTADGRTWADRVADTVRNTTEPPAEAFANPQLTAPTKVTVTDDGHVFGHVACWETSHISFPGREVKPPRSETGYAMFHRHAIRCTNGQRVKAGTLVAGTSHADLNMSTSAASSHYDHTGNIVADVCAGEDEHGIWVAGYLHPEVSPLQINILDRYSLSGDWRGGELVAALVVNTPGFPIPSNIAASGELCPEAPTTQIRTDAHGDQYALVAAGIVEPEHDEQVDLTDVVSELRQLRSELSQVLTRTTERTQTETAQGSDEAERVAREALARIYAPKFDALAAAATGTDGRPKRATKGEALNQRRNGRTGKNPQGKPPKLNKVAKKAGERRTAKDASNTEEAERQRQHELDVIDRQQEHEAAQAEAQRTHEAAENESQRVHESGENDAQRAHETETQDSQQHEASENERSEEYETERTKVQTEADAEQQDDAKGATGKEDQPTKSATSKPEQSGADPNQDGSQPSNDSQADKGEQPDNNADDGDDGEPSTPEDGESTDSNNPDGGEQHNSDQPDEETLKEAEKLGPEQRDLDKLPDDDEQLAKLLVAAGFAGDEEEARTFLADLDDPDALDRDNEDTRKTVTAANWVAKRGGLPRYFERIAKHLKRKGMSKSHAIATAINVAKKMCRGKGGDRLNFPGVQKDVNKGSVAQACAAVAKWNAMKASTGGSSSSSGSKSKKKS